MSPEPPADSPARASVRVPIAGEVLLRFERFSGFISEYAGNISLGGMFIRTRQLKPVGTLLQFEFRLADDFPLIRGKGEVVWTSWRDQGAEKPAGMGVRFLELDPEGSRLIENIVAERQKEGEVPFDLAGLAPKGEPPGPPQALTAPLWEPEPMAPGAEGPAAAPPPAGPSAPAAPEPAPVPPPTRPAPAASAPTGSRFAPAEPPAPVRRQPGEEEPPAERSRTAAGSRRRLVVLAVAAVAVVAGAAWTFGRSGWWRAAPAPTPADAESAPPAAVAADPSGPQAADPVSGSPAEPPAAAAAGAAPFRAVERVTWERQAGATLVTVVTDGRIAPERFSQLRLEGRPPREVVKLHGVTRPLPQAHLAVASAEVLQIRAGFHPSPGGGELHLVFDLASPAARLAPAEIAGDQLRLRFVTGR